MVARYPASPHNAAGARIEPPVSVPIAATAEPFCTLAAARASGETPRIVRLHAIAIIGILSCDAVGELMQVRLTDDDRTESAQTRGHGGVFVRDTVACGVEARAGTGGSACEIEA